MRDESEEGKLRRPRCPYCSSVLQRVATVTHAAKSPASFACLRGCGTFTGFTLAERRDGPDRDER